MRLTRAALLMGVALLPLVATAAPKKAAPRPAPAAGVKPIAYTSRTLANGLRVYAIRDTKTANVSVQVWYNVGSKDDPKGKSGFAHMFEHLMFKATRNLKSENFDRLTEDVGGENNASTNPDFTNYYEVVPANHLQRLLFAEADRMASLVVEPVSYASERDVVKEELRLRTLATPYGKLYSIYYPQISYKVHPYARPGIGSLDNLEAATIDDVRAFHATYYRPDNAVLVIAGNFEPADLDKWVDLYFAGIKRPDRPIPRVTVIEPARTKAESYTVYEPNTPLPAVLISYQAPPDNDADIPALTVLDAILSRGDSSRLYQDMVYRDQLAQSVNTFVETKQAIGAFVALAIMAEGKNVADGEKALRAEIARVRDTLVTPAELARAKNQLLTATIESRETADGKASTIARSVIVDGDPAAADKQLTAIARVTPADIQRVARRYLTDDRSAAIRYMPAEMANGAKSDVIGVAKTVEIAELKTPGNVEVVTPASDAKRILPPEPAKPIVAALPAPVTMKLANGMTLIVVEKHDLPLISASMIANGGGAADPADRAGLNNLTADLMTKGTTTRSATQIATEVEKLGGSIQSGAGWDSAEVELQVKSDQIAPALAVLADVTRNPVFAADELERDRAQTIDGVQVQLKDPARLAGLVATRAVMGDGPYAHPLAGTPVSLKAITRGDVQRAYAKTWQPDGATLIMVGDITPAAARVLAERNFGTWKNVGSRPVVPAPAAIVDAMPPRVIVVDMPAAGQAGVVVARTGIARSSPVFYAASVANAALGVGYSARLNQEIRIKRGLAYGAGSALAARRQPGYVAANTQTKNPSAPEVVGLIVDAMRGMGSAPVSASELASRKAVLIGDFGRETETTGGIANILGDYVIENVPLDELKAFTPKIDGIDAAAVQSISQRLLDPTNASIIVVGDAKLFIDELRKKYPTVEVIAADKLNLDNSTLK
ncbi:insulinase family protein [Sphingomonas panacisoli]|uniref:Insulinase family protein n=1 Tax=Sphingomonas panacisoli TaxID=1813879 RepID=A0A5B8LKK5_9SPHN|nr:pitrilysin family protein [Sphingomonas panacisoli]QDZ08459.1 insulinase family protein [Sphingomonas panacisoli]